MGANKQGTAGREEAGRDNVGRLPGTAAPPRAAPAPSGTLSGSRSPPSRAARYSLGPASCCAPAAPARSARRRSGGSSQIAARAKMTPYVLSIVWSTGRRRRNAAHESTTTHNVESNCIDMPFSISASRVDMLECSRHVESKRVEPIQGLEHSTERTRRDTTRSHSSTIDHILDSGGGCQIEGSKEMVRGAAPPSVPIVSAPPAPARPPGQPSNRRAPTAGWLPGRSAAGVLPAPPAPPLAAAPPWAAPRSTAMRRPRLPPQKPQVAYICNNSSILPANTQ